MLQLLLALTSLLVPAQDPGADQGPPALAIPEDEWILLDEVVMIVNEDIITRLSLLNELYRRQAEGEFSTQAGAERIWSQTLDRETQKALQKQAGQDLGLDPAEVKWRVDRFERSQIERFGGVVKMSQALDSVNQDSLELRKEWTDRLYSDTWEQITMGELPNGSGRYSRDRYVRPGKLRHMYETIVQRPELLGRIGGHPELFVLRELILDPRAYAGPEEARLFAEDLRDKIEAGEDMGQLVDLYGAIKGRQGLAAARSRAQILETDAGLAEFLDAPVGTVSAALPIQRAGLRGWRLLRLEERVPAKIPPLLDLDVQERLVEVRQKNLDSYRHSKAVIELFRGAYVWPPELRPR